MHSQLAETVNPRRWDPGDLEKLYDTQIVTLEERGVPEQLVEGFREQKAGVLKSAGKTAFWKDRIPFLPVIPRTHRGPHDLIAMVRNGLVAGFTYLNPLRIGDTVDVLAGLHYIFDVDDGRETLGYSAKEATRRFYYSRRQAPLTVAGVIALCVHTDVLSRHGVIAAGSLYETYEEPSVVVPYVYISAGGSPMLHWLSIEEPSKFSGVPSHGDRSE